MVFLELQSVTSLARVHETFRGLLIDYFSRFEEKICYFKSMKLRIGSKFLADQNSNREMLSADTDWNQFYFRIRLQHISFTQSVGASQEVFRYRYKYLKMKSEQSEKALNHVPDRNLENIPFIVSF